MSQSEKASNRVGTPSCSQPISQHPEQEDQSVASTIASTAPSSSNKRSLAEVADENHPLVIALLKKLRTTRSPSWDEFTRKIIVEPDKDNPVKEVVVLMGECHHCKKLVPDCSEQGTTRLAQHLRICPQKPQNNPGQMKITTAVKKAGTNQVKLLNYKYDPIVTRNCLAKMIAKHDYPLNMVEHFYFRDFVKSLNPAARMPCRNTSKADVLRCYAEMKGELQLQLENLTSKCSLTTDMWTAKHTKDGYCCVTCHFIDDEWNLIAKTLAYIVVPSPHTGDVLSDFIKTCTLEWNIDRKFFALTADNAPANGVMMRNLINCLDGKNYLLLQGKLFHMRCSNHILHLIVLYGMKVAAVFIEGIRDCVKYVKSSQARKEKFETTLTQCRLSGEVSLDVDTRWNSTFTMLKNAIKLREGFHRLSEFDSDFDIMPSSEQWDQGIEICNCLEAFNNISTEFAGIKYPTSNLYYNGVYKINQSITSWEDSTFEYVREMGLKMREKFNAYWSESNLIMSIGVVLDPRYKEKWVRFTYKIIFGDNERASVEYEKFRIDLTKIFKAYESQNNTSAPALFSNSVSRMDVRGPGTTNPDYATFLLENDEYDVQKSELETYLEEPILPTVSPQDEYNFDILSWWKLSAAKYPILSKIARDVLAVPVTSVASESMFSDGGRVLTTHRALLSPELVQALLCLSDWLPGSFDADMEVID
ncbi:hypothetical protein C5167_004500 [Papaver somniferum]|uniref:BED-type domain-containing protein n=1 Tax=Papaver somniferum TaxID=3469 RepID=A0A4Y7J9N4_PAPSO|nr:hypothetical protein C5167_004500 [Papaver somniferum]